MSNKTSAIERKKLRAIAVNNKPQHHSSQEIRMALDIVRTLETQYFDHEIQKAHLMKALEHHLAKSSNTSDTTISPNSSFVQ